MYSVQTYWIFKPTLSLERVDVLNCISSDSWYFRNWEIRETFQVLRWCKIERHDSWFFVGYSYFDCVLAVHYLVDGIFPRLVFVLRAGWAQWERSTSIYFIYLRTPWCHNRIFARKQRQRELLSSKHVQKITTLHLANHSHDENNLQSQLPLWQDKRKVSWGSGRIDSMAMQLFRLLKTRQHSRHRLRRRLQPWHGRDDGRSGDSISVGNQECQEILL